MSLPPPSFRCLKASLCTPAQFGLLLYSTDMQYIYLKSLNAELAVAWRSSLVGLGKSHHSPPYWNK